MPHPLLTFSQSDYLIQIVGINSHTQWQTVQIQIGWLLQKPADLDLHCLQRQGISGFIRSRVKAIWAFCSLWVISWCLHIDKIHTNEIHSYNEYPRRPIIWGQVQINFIPLFVSLNNLEGCVRCSLKFDRSINAYLHVRLLNASATVFGKW